MNCLTFDNQSLARGKGFPCNQFGAQDPGSLRAGMKVFHAKFGEGAGDDARAQINFPRHGIKWLALSVAKLTPLP